MNKSINIIGENKSTTVIHSMYYRSVVEVFADHVCISGFTIQNSGDDLDLAGINILSNYNMITDNIVQENQGIGIRLVSAKNNIIEKNQLEDNTYYHILLEACSNNTICKNNFTTSEDWPFICKGIWVSHSSHNVIQRNAIINFHGGVGIALDESSHFNIVKENIICNKTHRGNGIQISESNFNNILDNFIKSIKGSNSSGIISVFSVGNEISGNTIESVGNNGVALVCCENTIIKCNKVSFNKVGIGLFIQSNKNIIQFNNIMNNTIGLKITDLNQAPHLIGDCRGNKILFNNFIDNTDQAYDDNFLSLNIWFRNYYNDHNRIRSYFIPKYRFDLFPRMRPYKI